MAAKYGSSKPLRMPPVGILRNHFYAVGYKLFVSITNSPHFHFCFSCGITLFVEFNNLLNNFIFSIKFILATNYLSIYYCYEIM